MPVIAEKQPPYGTNPDRGLPSSKARDLLEQYGENRLQSKKSKNAFFKFLEQMKDYMVIILLITAIVSFVVAFIEHGDFIDPIIIMAIVILNGILGVTQENKAEKALDALQGMSAPTAKVIRDGITQQIPSTEVVPGDVIVLEAGDFIPADARLIESASLQCEESALTGESVPVQKDPHASVLDTAPVGDRLNMVFSGCSATYGRGKAIVTATGMSTEMGRIAELLNSGSSELTPLQKRLNQLGKYLANIAIGVCAVIFVAGLIQGMRPMDIFMTAVSLAVAAIPEGLTMVVTVVLALGVQRMVKQNAIIRNLPAVETLGSASVICSDKTGTLTQNRMTVQRIWASGKNRVEMMSSTLSPAALQVVRLGALCNDGRVVLEQDGESVVEKMLGDPTETAIVKAAMGNGMDKAELDAAFKRVAEIPFDSVRKMMTTVHEVNGRLIAVVKGGFDVLLPRCSDGDKSRAAEINNSMAKDALRVIAVACRELDELPEKITPETLENNLTFLGLIGMIDPPRPESKKAVELCHRAGIKTVMITGDHVSTASAIASQIGILEAGCETISGQELAAISDAELARSVEKYRVYARVSPEDKIRIVRAWQANGHVAAMTGDGVNDAPALKAADIGCAMGITGTDVAKGAADMVLTDDNFSTIVEAVRGGRGIFDNITKTIQFLLGSNLGEVFAVFFSMILGLGAPLMAIHLLLVNVITDTLPALALGLEPVESDIMDRKPIPPDQGIFANGLGLTIALQGAMIGVITLAAYLVGHFAMLSPLFPPSYEIGMTMAFLVLAMSQLSQAVNCRSKHSLFRIGLGSNRAMTKALLGSLAIILAICFIPPVASVFKIAPLSMMHWIWVSGLSISPLVIVEIVKAFKNRTA